MNKLLEEHSTKLREALAQMDTFHQQVLAVAQQFKEAFAKEKKVLVAGNGGSAAEAQHMSDEFVGRYKQDRPAYSVISLATDGAVLTCLSNDYGYEHVFRRQVEALGKKGDIFVGLTTSGTSKNILAAAEQARKQGMTVVALCGQTGPFAEVADYAIQSPSDKASVVQELHLHAIHLLCELFEREMK